MVRFHPCAPGAHSLMVKRVVDIDESVGSIPTEPTIQEVSSFWKRTRKSTRPGLAEDRKWFCGKIQIQLS